MELQVFTNTHDHQVLDPVVVNDAVDMVDMLAGQQVATEVLHHDKSVFRDVLPINTNEHVAAMNGIRKAPTVPVTVAFAPNITQVARPGTVMPGRNNRSTVPSREHLAAGSASQRDVVSTSQVSARTRAVFPVPISEHGWLGEKWFAALETGTLDGHRNQPFRCHAGGVRCAARRFPIHKPKYNKRWLP